MVIPFLVSPAKETIQEFSIDWHWMGLKFRASSFGKQTAVGEGHPSVGFSGPALESFLGLGIQSSLGGWYLADLSLASF